MMTDRLLTPRTILNALAACVVAAAFWFLFRPDPEIRDGKIHIRYWEKWTGFEEEAMRKVVEEFNSRSDRIHVEYLAVSQVNQKMLLATAGGNPPDVAGIWDYDVVSFADANALTPLDEFCRADGVGPEDYLPSYWQSCVHNRTVFAMPTTPASVALHWNRAAYRKAGLDPDRPPRTMSELDRMAEKLTVRDPSGRITQAGYLPAEPGWWNWGWGYFFGGSLYDGQGHATLTTPENLRAFHWVKDYVDKYRARDIQVFQSGFGNFSSPQNAFMSGQVAMVMQGVWMANFIHNNNPSLDWDAAPFPYPDDRPDLARSTPVGLDVVVIPRGAKHPREAWEFIRFVQSQEGMEMLCLGQWKHSPLANVSERFFRVHKNKRIRLFYELAKGKNTFTTPQVGIWREWTSEMTAAFQNIWVGGESPEKALGAAQAQIQPKLTAYLEGVQRRRRVSADPSRVASARR